MDINLIMDYITQYGAWAVFIVIFLEYLNIPVPPSGILMPVVGICAANGQSNFITVLCISVIAGLCGSCLLYGLGRKGGTAFLAWMTHRFPKQKPIIDNAMVKIQERGYWGLLVAKLIPVVRTNISLPAGVMQMNFSKYLLFSLLGIMLWNSFFIGAGYIFGNDALTLIGALW